jgi:hypothetical protein
MEIALPLKDRLFAILTLEGTGALFGPLFLCGRVVHAARTGKMDGYLGAIAHPLKSPEYAMRKVNIPALFGCHNQTDPLPGFSPVAISMIDLASCWLGSLGRWEGYSSGQTIRPF